MSILAPDNALLKKAEVEAEQVVSLLRIAVALGLLAMFFLAVKGSNSSPENYLRRQWVFAVATMSSYLLVGMISLWMARTGRIRSWMVWPLVTVDCLFMLVNAWVGLANTGLPGELTFILPPTWLVPVIFGFTVLRFNPYLQAYCVAVIAVGLAALSLWQPEEVTPFIVERAQILLSGPPNIIRVTMIALGGVVLVVAAWRTRRLVHRSITEAQQKANLTRYLPAQLTHRLAEASLDNLRRGERQNMAVLFIDIRGFTRWSQDRDPQVVGSYITDFRSRVQGCSDASGGMIDKFMGDAAMVLFEGDEAATRAIECASALKKSMTDWSDVRQESGEDAVLVGIGLHWGEVFSGVVGDPQRLEYTVFGDTVNIAARLEQLTKQEKQGIIVSAAVLQAASVAPASQGWIPLPAAELRGRSGGIEIFGRG
ncbi:adenylate/guanylate cyclase domain-containing protein [Parasedimentitalea maritima]|uniref:Adenylate/guanylate cyclase domain-containing protein n=1 Tax=Parasedimentitalea maritima TaxID=2578117 RepID=A0A6A4RJ10_9RHOB|nr:adenylate/guanylate cyclase domain-containing protein [Zongyanglinia marina]KAE9631111.1 adenylate/guanylate cyclase domain-containing protein [Zongyanglinia marina]